MADAWCWVSAGSRAGGGALACVELGGDVERALGALGVASVVPGSVRLRMVPVGSGVKDEAVVARWTTDRATFTTHGGRAVVDGLLGECAAREINRRVLVEAREQYPEAADGLEALMLDALALAASPAGVDLLLDQPRRWREAQTGRGGLGTEPPRGGGAAHRDALLRRLIEPALVVAAGPPNVGKSSLLNALAGRGVAVVADQAGTTRDHVGALIDLGGVVVRWVDTPGLEAKAQSSRHNVQIDDPDRGDREVQTEAQRIALEVAAAADVLVVCGDATARVEPPPTSGAIVRVGLRADLGAVDGIDASVSVREGIGLERLVEAVREAVVPRRWMEDGEPWVFWE